MSEAEYELFSSQLADIDEEISQYGEQLPKCAVLLQAVQFADASECIAGAYDGAEDDMLGAYATVENLESDVDKGCLKALRLYKERLDVFYGYTKTTFEAGERLQFAEFSQLAGMAGRQTRRYRQGREWALAACSPS